jgi:hypothetical protein
MRGAVLVVAIVLLASACASASGSGPVVTDPEATELQAARQRWAAAGIDDYVWTFRRYCFCPPLRVRVRVQDGLARERTVLEGFQEETSFDFVTMEALFDEIDEELATADDVDARYDPATGAVISVRFDRRVDAVDDELEWRVPQLEPA